MEKLQLRQDVALVFIMTDDLKARLLDELSSAAEEVQRQIEQFDFRARHALAELQRTDLNRAMAARQQIEGEKRRLEAMKQELTDRRTETEKFDIGSEYPRGTIEGLVDIQVGDNLFEKLAGIQMVVKDNIVVEFRKLAMTPEDLILPQPRIAQPGE